MSSIGPSSIGPANLAGSIAGTQQTDANRDARQARAADTNMQIDQKASAAHGDDDVVEADLSSDRDADGHSGYGAPEHDPVQDLEEPEPQQEEHHGRNIDVDGILGTGLDLEA